MAIRIQLRRDTAANWVSSNPVLRQGEIGIETDTLQMKLGNGTNTWTQITAYMNLVPDGNLTIGDYVMVNDIGAVSGVVGLDGSKNALIPGSSIIVEGPTDNSFETTLTVTDPTADRTITFKNADGTVAFVSDIPSTTDTLTEGSTNKYFSDELAQDAVATALAAGSHTNITVSYNDASNSLSLAAAPGYVDEQAVDAVAAALAAGTHTNISVSYNDAGNAISLTGAVTYSDENAQDAIGNSLGTGLSYNDTTGAISVDTTAIQAKVANVDDTEIGYLNGVTSGIQTQIDTKLASSTAATTYAPIASPTFTGTVSGVTATHVGLGNVDNTSDANKPVSTATQTALDLKAPLASPTFTGTLAAADLTLSGDLTVNGTTTNLNSTNLVIEDKNIVLGDTATPTDVTADGGGITLKGTTDKTLNWVDATDAWTSSEHINLATGKTLKYNGTDLVASQTSNSGKYLTTDGTSTSWGTVSGYSAPTLGSTLIASGATVTTIAGLTLTSPIITGTPTINGTGDFLISGTTNIRLIPGSGNFAYIGSLAADNIIVTAGNAQTLNAKTLTNTVTINTLTVGLGGGSVSNNTAVGVAAQSATTTGQNNTAVGYNALIANTGGTNTAIGSFAMAGQIYGGNNVAIGYQALQNSANCSQNVAIGYVALRANTGGNSIGIGSEALLVSTGAGNTAVGNSAGLTLTTGTNNTLIGNLAAPSSITVSNEITLGNSSITTFRIPGLSISATTTALTVPSLTPTNAIGAIYGGTGLSTYTTGDILYSSASNTLAKLAAGTNGQILTLASGIPSWAAAPAGFSAPTLGSTSIASGSTVTSIAGLTLNATSTTTVSTNTASTIDTIALNSFTTVKYLVSIKQGSKVRSSEVIAQTDGSSVDYTEFGITETGGPMFGVLASVSVSSTNAVLQVTITNAATTNATVKIQKVLI